MGYVVFKLQEVPDVGVIIATVKAEMLFTIRAVNHHREDQVLQRTLVMAVGGRDADGQRCDAAVHQEGSFFTTQWCRAILAIGRLPFPASLAFFAVELDHFRHDQLEEPQLAPQLEPLMRHATRDTKRALRQRLPLAACPQHVPDGVQHCSVANRRASAPASLPLLGQQMLDAFPQRLRGTRK